MAKREVRIGLATYRRANLPELMSFGMLGETVDVHPDDLERFDRLNGPAQPVDVKPLAPEAPAGNASLEEWQAYARSQGATDADIEDKTRNDLRAQYGA